MAPTHAVKKGVRYRYYVSQQLITGRRRDGETGGDAGQRLPAVEIERLVIRRVRNFFADPDAVCDALPPDRRDAPSRRRALQRAQEIVRTIDEGLEANAAELLGLLIARAQVRTDRIEIELRRRQVVEALLPGDVRIAAMPADAAPDADPEPATDGVCHRLRLIVPCALKRTGKEMKFVIDGADESTTPDPRLVRLLLRAHALSQRLASNPGSTLSDVGPRRAWARLMRRV